MMPESLMRVLTPTLLSVGRESRNPMSGPTFSSLLLHEGNNNSVAAAMMTAATLSVCVNRFKCQVLNVECPDDRNHSAQGLISGGAKWWFRNRVH